MRQATTSPTGRGVQERVRRGDRASAIADSSFEGKIPETVHDGSRRKLSLAAPQAVLWAVRQAKDLALQAWYFFLPPIAGRRPPRLADHPTAIVFGVQCSAGRLALLFFCLTTGDSGLPLVSH